MMNFIIKKTDLFWPLKGLIYPIIPIILRFHTTQNLATKYA